MYKIIFLPITGAGVIRGSVAVSWIAKEAGLSQPERIRSSNMRKYMATMTQVSSYGTVASN